MGMIGKMQGVTTKKIGQINVACSKWRAPAHCPNPQGSLSGPTTLSNDSHNPDSAARTNNARIMPFVITNGIEGTFGQCVATWTLGQSAGARH